ncbi:COP9 signalosome complex subunit 3 [Balamuthia mandrillaris]
MDKLINAIQSVDPKDEKELKNLQGLLKKNEELLFKNLPHLDEILSILDPNLNTLAWIHILGIKAVVASSDPLTFVGQVSRLIKEGNTQQIRLSPFKFSRVCSRYAEIYRNEGRALACIRPLRMALQKLRPNSDTLTPLHADFLQMCLLAKDYRAALPVLAEEVLAIADPERYGFKPVDLLRYFYYGGMVYVGVKQFEQALEFFKQGFSAPAVVLSAVMVECYKKFVLVSLLLHGTLAPVPKYTPSVVQRYLKSACPQYQELINAFATRSTDEVHKVATQHAEAFQKDNNFGLVKQCIQALYRSNINRHTQTYLTLSLDQIAETVKLASPKDAEKAILGMIEEGKIFATVDQKGGMVSFHESPEAYNTNDMLNFLDLQIHNSIDMARKLKTVDQEISSSIPYLQKTAMHERQGGGRWGELGPDFDMDARPPGLGRKGGRKGKGKVLGLAN